MTDKKIIIDGVNVRECICHMEGIRGMTCAGTFLSCSCSKNPNCDFKQLKRKEQECEELKEQLKKEIETSQKWYQLHTEKHFAKLEVEQALAEIKEIVENMNEECFYTGFDCMYCDIQNGCTNKKQILQLISEV